MMLQSRNNSCSANELTSVNCHDSLSTTKLFLKVADRMDTAFSRLEFPHYKVIFYRHVECLGFYISWSLLGNCIFFYLSPPCKDSSCPRCWLRSAVKGNLYWLDSCSVLANVWYLVGLSYFAFISVRSGRSLNLHLINKEAEAKETEWLSGSQLVSFQTELGFQLSCFSLGCWMLSDVPNPYISYFLLYSNTTWDLSPPCAHIIE